MAHALSTEHLDTGVTSEPVGGEAAPAPVIGPAPSAQTDAAIAPAMLRTDPLSLPRVPAPHAHKFRLAGLLLFLVAATAIAGTIVFLVNHDKKHHNGLSAAAAKWSTWHPANSGTEGTTEIADHVAPYYRLSASQQLDAVTPVSMSESNDAGVTTGSGLTVVVNTASSSSKSENLELLIGKTVAYNVCGLGPSNCELAGKASTSRMLLLRREALELALYTFKYEPNVQNVITVLPPGHSANGSAVTVSVLFVRAELKTLLRSPLDSTLSSYPLEVSELPLWAKTTEAEIVDEITSEGLFSSKVESQQEGGNLLVLTPLPTQ